MKSLVISWLATVLAFATLLVLPNVSVTSLSIILLPATLIWLLLILLWPLAKLFLLPFNMASYGLASTLAYFLLFWLCLWIFPGVRIQPVTVAGIYIGDISILFFISFMLSLLQRAYSMVINQLFAGKRRK